MIIDTDIGGDDAQALIYAIDQSKNSNIKIIGITCVNGNTFVQHVAKNAVIVQALCNTEIPVYLGMLKIKFKVVRTRWLETWTRIIIFLKMGWEPSRNSTGKSIFKKGG